MGEPDWKRRIGLADTYGTVVEVEHSDVGAWLSADSGPFSLRVLDPEPSAVRQFSAALLDLADRMEGEHGGA